MVCERPLQRKLAGRYIGSMTVRRESISGEHPMQSASDRHRPGRVVRQRGSDRRQFQTSNVGDLFFAPAVRICRPSPFCNMWKVKMPERAIIWEPLVDVDFPCPRLDFEFTDSSDLSVVMRFSELNTGNEPRKPDLELRFSGVIGLRWAPEFHGS